MSVQIIKCPYCGSETKVFVNYSVKMSVSHKKCYSCKKQYTYQGIYGRVVITEK